MVENYFVTERKRNKTKLLNYLLTHKDLTIDQACARFSAMEGFKVTTLKTWTEEFVMAGMIVIDNNVVQ